MPILDTPWRWLVYGAAAVVLAGGPPAEAHAARLAARPSPAASAPASGSVAAGAALLMRSCGGCHAPGRKGARDLLLFDTTGRLEPAAMRAERDVILEIVATNHGRPRLTPAEVDLLRRWLEADDPPD